MVNIVGEKSVGEREVVTYSAASALAKTTDAVAKQVEKDVSKISAQAEQKIRETESRSVREQLQTGKTGTPEELALFG